MAGSTLIVDATSAGEPDASAQRFALIYDEPRRFAARKLANTVRAVADLVDPLYFGGLTIFKDTEQNQGDDLAFL
jgi:hypothetical protein